MSAKANRNLGFVLLACLVVGSVAAAVHASKQIRFYRDQIDARIGELNELDRLQREREGVREAFLYIEKQAQADNRLEDLVKRHLDGVETDLAMRERTLIGEGWSTLRYDLRMERVPAAKLEAFLAACEQADPRVRIEELQVTAREDTARDLAAQLSLAELVRPDLGSAP